MRRLILSALLVLAAASSVAAQAPQPPPTYEAAVLRTWRALHDKILVMAKDTQFPDAKLSWKPHPDSRSVMDELRHVTIGLRMTSAVARGEKTADEAQKTMPQLRRVGGVCPCSKSVRWVAEEAIELPGSAVGA